MNFPDHFIDSVKKDRKWYLQMVMAGWEEWEHTDCESFLKGASRYQTNRLFSLGQQPVDTHKPMQASDDDTNESFMSIDHSAFGILPKLRRAALGRISKMQDEIHADAIDPLAKQEKVDYERKERANIKVREKLNGLGISDEVLNSGENDQPTTTEALDMRMMFSYKHNMAMDTEIRIKTVFEQNHIDEKRDETRRNIFDIGCAGYRDWTDESGRVHFRAVSIDRFMCSPTEDRFFRDIWYGGEIIFLTIAEIRKIAGDTISESEYDELKERYSSVFDNPRNYGLDNKYGYVKGYDGYLIPVLDFEFLTTDEDIYESRIGKGGNKVIGRTPYRNKSKVGKTQKNGRSYDIEQEQRTCQVKWILDSKVIFDYGYAFDVPKKASSPWYSRLSYSIVAPELFAMNTISVVDHVKPVVELIQGTWLKLQNAIAQARPKGIAIDLTALESISLGEGYENMKPIDVLDMYNQTGTLVYRMIDIDGRMTPAKPIEELDGGIGQQAKEYFDLLQGLMNMMGGIVGLNDFTDASTPDPRSLIGIGAMAIESTANALQFLVDAERNLLERLADNVAMRVHDSIYLKKSDVYANTGGGLGMKSAGEKAGQYHREYDIVVKDRGDKFEQERLAVRIENALKNQQITIDQATSVENLTNLKQSEMLLSYYVKINMEMAAAQAEKAIEDNARVQQESAQNASAIKINEIDAGSEAKINEAKAKGEEERKTIELKHENEMELKELDSQGKEDVQEVTNEGLVETQVVANVGAISAAKVRSKSSQTSKSA